MKSVGYLKQELKDQKISQPYFAEQYYRDEVDDKATEVQISAHLERFKALLKSKDTRSPERIMAYINYFDRRYKNENRFTQADRSAAWEMFIELDTRIATRELNGGDSSAALMSLAALFNLHRDNAKQHGPNCKLYYQLVNGCFEKQLRPFTAKWHAELTPDTDMEFREELCALQKYLDNLKKSLEKMSN